MNPATVKFVRAVGTEAAVMIAGALVASFLIGQVPQLRAWMKRQWDGVPGGLG